MQNVRVYATRKAGVIRVNVLGDLEDTCQVATIDDMYPGGHRHYSHDPGEAQVFIKQEREGDDQVCQDVLTPWKDVQSIQDDEHGTVGIYVNDERVAVAAIKDFNDRWIVIALTGGEGTFRYRVIPEESIYPAIYSRVHGPDSQEECQEWARVACKANNALGLSAILPPTSTGNGGETLRARGTGTTFDAAFWDAVENLYPDTLPSTPPAHPDSMTIIKVVEMGARLGGFEGLLETWVAIEAESD